MADTTEDSDGSFTVPLTDDCIREAAADYPVTDTQVREALSKLQDGLEAQIHSLYEDAWLMGGPQNHLSDAPEGVFFALTPHDIREAIDSEIETELLQAVCAAHKNMAALWGFQVDRPTAYADTLVADYRAVYVAYPAGWKSGMYHARVRMMYLLRHGLTPTEALDYWALKSGQSCLQTTQSEERWRASRGVDHEATYKTVRQAREKLDDPENQPYHEKQDIGIRDVDEE